MPTFGDETLRDRYAREHADHLARLAKMTPEQIAEMELSLHNAMAELDRLRAKASQGGEAVAWAICKEPGKVDWLSATYANKRAAVAHVASYKDGLPLYITPLYTHPADQVADDLTMVKVSRESEEDDSCPECFGAGEDHCGPCKQCGGEGSFEAALRLSGSHALLANQEGVKK